MEKLLNSERLKIHTHKVHVDLEQALIPIIRSIDTRSRYAQLLKLFYTFYAPIENQLTTVTGIEEFIGGITLRKSDSLKNDIEALEDSTEDLAFCSDLPRCADISQALGILYVLEGSVLGGTVIASLIAKQVNTNGALPFSFFLHYGDEAKNRWQHFKTRLDSMEDLSQPELLSTAADTFLLFKIWIDKSRASI